MDREAGKTASSRFEEFLIYEQELKTIKDRKLFSNETLQRERKREKKTSESFITP